MVLLLAVRFLYSWRKIEGKIRRWMDQFSTMVKGLFRKDRLLAVIMILSISRYV